MMNWNQFQQYMEKQEQLRAQGIETRKVVVVCQDCGDSIYESQISADEETHIVIDGKEICHDCVFERLGRLVERHPIGRASTHGCHGLE